jgi:putative transposase
MEPEVGALTGAAQGERSPDRLTRRNSCRERDRVTWAGGLRAGTAGAGAG